jgi:hypothetical protein
MAAFLLSKGHGIFLVRHCDTRRKQSIVDWERGYFRVNVMGRVTHILTGLSFCKAGLNFHLGTALRIASWKTLAPLISPTSSTLPWLRSSLWLRSGGSFLPFFFEGSMYIDNCYRPGGE